MQSQSIEEYFASITSCSQKLLSACQEIKQKISSNQQFILDTIQFLCSQQQPSSQQFKLFFNTITLIHPSLIEVFSSLNQKIQEDVRGGLLNCVVTLYKDRRAVAALGLLIREMVEVDSLQPWMEPFAQLLKWMASEDPQVVQAGIQFFIFLLKETDYNQSNSDMPLHKLAPPLLQVLYQLFANSQLQQRIREKLLFLVLQLIKTFSIFDGYKDQIVKECFEQTYSIWMSFFTSTLQSTIYSNITIKKYIMKILVIIFRDMQKYLNEKQKEMPAQLYVVWEFCYKMLPLHLWANVWEKDILQYKDRDSFGSQQQIPNRSSYESFLYYQQDSQSMLSPSESLVLTILQFLSVLTSIPHLNTTIKVSIHHLTNSLFHFMLLCEFQTMFWRYNTQQFLTHNIVNDYQVTIRNKTMAILNQLIEKCGDYAIQAILMVAEKFLLNIPEAHTTQSVKDIMQNVIDIKTLPQLTLGIYQSPEKLINLVKLSSCDVRQTLHVSGQTWRKMQVALVVLGRFAQDIIVFQSKQQAAFDIESFVNGLIKQVKDDEFYELLKGQSLYCLTRFTQIISIKYRHLFTQLCLACIQCLSSSLPISVKAISCRALTLFLRKIQKHKLQFNQEDQALISTKNVVKCLMDLHMYSQITNVVLEVMIEACRNQSIGMDGMRDQAYPEYLLTVFHKNVTHTNTIQLFFVLLQEVSKPYEQYKAISRIFINFIEQCLKSFSSIIQSQQVRLQLKSGDIQLIMIVLRIANVLITRGFQLCCQQNLLTSQNKQQIRQSFICLIPLFTSIIRSNNDVQIHIQVTICYKNVLKLSHQNIKQNQQLVKMTVDNIKNLLKIPKDKTFQSSAVYAGNLAILAFDKVLQKINYQILQQAVLKVFRSRTPSVIQSLVLIYSRLINLDTDINEPFQINKSSRITDLIDFLSSFSIQNRMGLKILIDKWLLQQSLFRGKYTKISTFMALSKLFLLDDKRIDNLLVIGFNPSHTNVCNDVSSPLKILATLIRCLDNEKGFQKNQQSQSQEENKDDGKVDVNLEKFKEEKDDQQQQGGLADRENQQGSTCYMSAMLEFYDDGEQCDQTTEDDLLYLNDSATKFVLADYLIQFFNYLIEHKKEHFKECLKGILKQDVKTLSKYVKID